MDEGYVQLQLKKDIVYFIAAISAMLATLYLVNVLCNSQIWHLEAIRSALSIVELTMIAFACSFCSCNQIPTSCITNRLPTILPPSWSISAPKTNARGITRYTGSDGGFKACSQIGSRTYPHENSQSQDTNFSLYPSSQLVKVSAMEMPQYLDNI